MLERLATARGRALRPVDVEAVLVHLVAREDHDWLAGVLPPELSRLPVCKPVVTRALTTAVAQVGAGEGLWPVFASLYPSFTGSMGDLVATCSAVADGR